MKKTSTPKTESLKTADVLANIEAMPLTADLGPENNPGQLYLANASRFVEANFSEPLTTYGLGWNDEDDLLGLLAFIAPDVPVTRRFEFAKMTNAEIFLAETDDLRGIGADFKRVQYTSDKQVAQTINKGLTYRVDRDNIDEENQPDWERRVTARLINRLRRNDIRRAYTLLSAACTNVAKVWSDGATDKDPDSDLDEIIDLFGDGAGMEANRLLIGRSAWRFRRKGYGIQATSAGFNHSGDPDDLGTELGVSILISKARYQSTSSAKAKLTTAGLVNAFRAEGNALPDDPSSIKRFVTNAAGSAIRVFRQEIGLKFIDITVEHYSQIIVTSTLGLRQLTVT